MESESRRSREVTSERPKRRERQGPRRRVTAQLPPRLAPFRKLTLRCLGAAAPWVDREDPLSRLVVHGQADGNEAVQAADRLVARLRELRSAGLGMRESFLVLQT